MSAIDGIDIVSLLLAGVTSLLLVDHLNSRRVGLTLLTRALLFGGATLVLGYVCSEVLHALRPFR